jgi:hypothetical protein
MPTFSFTAICLPLLKKLRRKPHGREDQNDRGYVLNVLSETASGKSRLMDNRLHCMSVSLQRAPIDTRTVELQRYASSTTVILSTCE